MRIAVTIESFGSGGAETSTRQIAEGLRDRGHAVTLLTGFAPPERSLHGIPIEAAGTTKLKTGRAIRRYRAFATGRMKTGGFDTSLSVTTLCPAKVVQPRAGIYQELWSAAPQWAHPPKPWKRATRPPWWKGKRRAMWDAETATLADPAATWVAISRFMQEQIANCTSLPASAIYLIANAAPMAGTAGRAPSDRQNQRADWAVDDSVVVFLFAANDPDRKGLTPLIGATGLVEAKRATGTALVVHAPGLDHWLKHRLFRPPTRDMDSAFAAADVLVLPSFYDPAAKVVAEALQAGVPVITTRTNGSCDLIDGSPAGRIIEHAWDTEALAAAMLEFCHPAVLAEARAATAAAAAGATMDEHVDKLLAVLEAAAG